MDESQVIRSTTKETLPYVSTILLLPCFFQILLKVLFKLMVMPDSFPYVDSHIACWFFLHLLFQFTFPNFVNFELTTGIISHFFLVFLISLFNRLIVNYLLSICLTTRATMPGAPQKFIWRTMSETI